MTEKDILEGMEKDYNIMISGCFDVLAGVVVRIGHMGENARMEQVQELLDALEEILRS